MGARAIFIIMAPLIVTACHSLDIPKTLGDPADAPAYGYNPLDSLPVAIKGSKKSDPTVDQKLKALPDETMRLAIGVFDSKGDVKYGPAAVGVAGNSYVVVLDYVKFTTNSFPVKKVEVNVKRESSQSDVSVQQSRPKIVAKQVSEEKDTDVIVPVYVGVGLRLTANVTVREGTVDLGNLVALGVAAQAKQISGTLVIQSLGLSGPGISPYIPIPNEINTTTIQNAIQAIGAIKAKMYDKETEVTPRVVGVYNNVGGGQETINGFISSILQKPPTLKIIIPEDETPDAPDSRPGAPPDGPPPS
jgi:hypothetical protein